MSNIIRRTNPSLWQAIVSDVKASDKGGKSGEWSARKAQLATQRYKAQGGGYTKDSAPKEKTSLRKWTAQKWRTRDGKPARREVKGKMVTARYLPDKAWGQLTPAQAQATDRKKRRGEGQFVPNTSKAREARKQS